jgi:hypothetical protein
MSELLDYVSNWNPLDETHRVDPHVMCKGTWSNEKFWFLVTDDGWHGRFIAQYARHFATDQLGEAAHLIRRIGRRSAHFHFDYRDDVGQVRAVYQLPIANEPRWEDDVPTAAYTLLEEWATLLPFLRRIESGELAENMIADAKRTFAEVDAQNRRAEVPLGGEYNGVRSNRIDSRIATSATPQIARADS